MNSGALTQSIEKMHGQQIVLKKHTGGIWQ
jgi:hypothetical protein